MCVCVRVREREKYSPGKVLVGVEHDDLSSSRLFALSSIPLRLDLVLLQTTLPNVCVHVCEYVTSIIHEENT